jgi:hypothetical protein
VSEVALQAELFAAIARATATARAVGKDATNSFHRYKYASAESLIEEARGPLSAEGVCVLPSSWRLTAHEVDGNGYFADVVVTYLVAHASGGSIMCEASTPVLREKGRPEDKAVATALTYSLGYFLRGLLMLPRVDAEHDADQRDDREYKPPAKWPPVQPPKNDQSPPKAATPPEPEATFSLDDALKAMADARNVNELHAVGSMLADAPAQFKATLKAAYRGRKQALEQEASDEAIAKRDAE